MLLRKVKQRRNVKGGDAVGCKGKKPKGKK